MDRRNAIRSQVPEFVLEQYPAFIDFLEEYYKWFDEIYSSGEYSDLVDIDDTLEAFLKYFRKQLDLHGVTLNQADRKFLKNIKELYNAKGSSLGAEIFFKTAYNKNSRVYEPWQDTFKTSNAAWIQDVSIIVTITSGDASTLEGNTITITDSNNYTYITYVRKVSQRSGSVYELFIDRFTPSGTLISFINFDSSVTGTINQVPSNIKISSAGSGFRPGDVFQLRDGATGIGSGSKFVVTEVTPSGGITKIAIVDFGFGYETDFTVGWNPPSLQTNLLASTGMTGTAEDGNNSWVTNNDLFGYINNINDPTYAKTGKRSYSLVNTGDAGTGDPLSPISIDDLTDADLANMNNYGGQTDKYGVYTGPPNDASTSRTLSLDTTEKYTGKQSLKIVSGATGGIYFRTNDLLDTYYGGADPYLTATAYVKCNQARSVGIRFYESSTVLSLNQSRFDIPANQWTRIQTSYAGGTGIDASAASPEWAAVQINTAYANTPSAVGDILWIDDIRVWKNTDQPPIQANYNKTYDDKLPVGARFTASVDVLGSTGTPSSVLTGDVGSTGVTDGKDVLVRTVFKDSTGATGNSANITTTVALGSGSTGWQNISSTIELLPEWDGYYDTINMHFNLDTTGEGPFDIWFADNAKLTEVVGPNSAFFDVTLGNFCVYPGYYDNTSNTLGDAAYIQNHYYQLHSYATSLEEFVSKYKELLRAVIHPAGTSHTGIYNIKNTLSHTTSANYTQTTSAEEPPGVVDDFYTSEMSDVVDAEDSINKILTKYFVDYVVLRDKPTLFWYPDTDVSESGATGITFDDGVISLLFNEDTALLQSFALFNELVLDIVIYSLLAFNETIKFDDDTIKSSIEGIRLTDLLKFDDKSITPSTEGYSPYLQEGYAQEGYVATTS